MKKISFESLIIGEDSNYIAVNKPAYLSSLDDRHDPVSLLSLAKAYDENLQLCHRLDKETSGILILSKNAEAYRNLSMQLEKREVLKIYHAIVDGVHDFKEDVVNVPLKTLAKGIVRVDTREGKEATTVFKTLEAYRFHTLVGCFPLSGRMHQIRVHAAWMKAPLVGDDTYGGKPLFLSAYKKQYNIKDGEDELPIIKRVALHAKSFRFRTLNGDELGWEAPYPKDFKVAVNQLRKFTH